MAQLPLCRVLEITDYWENRIRVDFKYRHLAVTPAQKDFRRRIFHLCVLKCRQERASRDRA